MTGEQRDRPGGQDQGGDTDTGLTFAPNITRRCPQVKAVARARCPAVNYIIVVDDFALNPDIDFPIACFERWPVGAP